MSVKLRMIMITIALVVLACLGTVALQVDDWSRDLTTNRAATSADASDPQLRSLALSATPEKVQQTLDQFAAQSDRWTVGETVEDGEACIAVSLVRTTPLLRFADDVTVSLQPTATGTLVDIESQSRIGKGDLGQNPRNIRELMQALHDRFQTAQSNVEK